MESKSDFSNLLKDYRKKNGLTQKAFASLVGLSYDTIIGYEHGRSKPSPVARKKIAEKTGIEIALIPQGKNGAKIDYSEPLTDEEREFAEINHSEIWKFLRIKRLSFDEWYDISCSPAKCSSIPAPAVTSCLWLWTRTGTSPRAYFSSVSGTTEKSTSAGNITYSRTACIPSGTRRTSTAQSTPWNLRPCRSGRFCFRKDGFSQIFR